MPSWFADHLACAPLASWLPDLLAQRRVALVESVRLPRAIAPWLAGATPLAAPTPLDADAPLDAGATPLADATPLAHATHLAHADPVDVVVHVGALHSRPTLDIDAITACGAEVIVDLARVDRTVGWWSLRPWRLAPVRRDAVRRAAWLAELGFASPQQWVCRDPFAMVVTIGERRRG